MKQTELRQAVGLSVISISRWRGMRSMKHCRLVHSQLSSAENLLKLCSEDATVPNSWHHPQTGDTALNDQVNTMAPSLHHFFVTATMINYPYLTVAVVIESYAAQVYDALGSGHFATPLLAITGPKGHMGALKDGSRGTHQWDQFPKELKRSICSPHISGMFPPSCLRPACKGSVCPQLNALSINHSRGCLYTKWVTAQRELVFFCLGPCSLRNRTSDLLYHALLIVLALLEGPANGSIISL